MEKQVKLLYVVIGLLSLVLVCLVFGGGLVKRSEAASPAASAGQSGANVGRYRVLAEGSQASTLIMVDTETGKCWYADNPGASWTEWNAPK